MAAAAGVIPGAGEPAVLSAEEQRELIEANRQLSELAAAAIEDSAMLRRELAARNAEYEKLQAGLAVLQRLVFGRSSEKNRPEPAGDDGDAGPAGDGSGGEDKKKRDVKRGPGARSGRRDYSHLPRFEVFWDFPEGGYCCPECGEPFTPLGDHWSGEQLDWLVIVRLAANCQRRYKRACECRVPATVMAPGPPKAVGKGLFTNAFIAMLLTERFAAGRSQNSLVTGLARQGAEVSPATLAGTCGQAAALLAPLEAAIAERNRDSWHLHADETTWRVFCPGDGDGPARFWLWVF
ncbi:MAG: IS66 family transposase, partial [Streptosporangiaceae bacterium]